MNPSVALDYSAQSFDHTKLINLHSANKNPRTKAPSLQALVNKIVVIIVVFVIALTVFNTVAYQIWQNRIESRSWYLGDSSVALFPVLASYFIMYETQIHHTYLIRLTDKR